MNFPKFKAYLKEAISDQRIYQVDSIDFIKKMLFLGGLYIARTFNEIILFQWTGITDCNGEKIYGGFEGEGDIVEMAIGQEGPDRYEQNKYVGIVVWDIKNCGWALKDTKNANGFFINLKKVHKVNEEDVYDEYDINLKKLGNSLTDS